MGEARGAGKGMRGKSGDEVTWQSDRKLSAFDVTFSEARRYAANFLLLPLFVKKYTGVMANRMLAS